MITGCRKWHYLAITHLSALLQGKSSNHYGDFHCLNLIHIHQKLNLRNMKKYAIITIAVI